MDIESLGDERIVQLADAGLLHGIASLYSLRKEQLAALPRWGERSAEKVLAEVGRSKDAGLSRLLFALGIRHVGEKMGKVLAERFLSMDALAASSEEDLVSTPGVGPEIAKSIRLTSQSHAFQELIRQLREAGVRMNESVRPVSGPGPWSGRTFVLTGTLERMSRDDASAKIEAKGGKVSSSVSRKTSAVIAGNDPGSKLEKARDLGVSVWDEERFETELGSLETSS
jgi:DNA ligase (NAD+)